MRDREEARFGCTPHLDKTVIEYTDGVKLVPCFSARGRFVRYELMERRDYDDEYRQHEDTRIINECFDRFGEILRRLATM